MRNIILSILVLLTSISCFAKNEYEDQLKQLTGEIAAFTVGTKDATFESCTYEDDMIAFVLNPQSKISKTIIADPFAENFYENMLAKMFGGNPQQGVQIMDFLVGTHTNFCFKLKNPGCDNYSVATVYPGDVKKLILAAQSNQ